MDSISKKNNSTPILYVFYVICVLVIISGVFYIVLKEHRKINIEGTDIESIRNSRIIIKKIGTNGRIEIYFIKDKETGKEYIIARSVHGITQLLDSKDSISEK